MAIIHFIVLLAICGTAADKLYFQSLLAKNKICPNGKVSCRSSQTCCKLKSGDYGCCPFKKAVCCSDRVHCCPQGYKCDLLTMLCLKGNHVRSPTKVLSGSLGGSLIPCPGHKTFCSERSTCCRTGSNYGCCPYRNAVCCSDLIHCCPMDTVCDVYSSRCIYKSGSSISMYNLLEEKLLPHETLTVNMAGEQHLMPGSPRALIPSMATPIVVVCPDEATSCPEHSTCCYMKHGGYGCCPFVHGVCCRDGLMCCPQGHSCDLEKHSCVGNDLVSKTTGNYGIVVCPGGSFCSDTQTCCILPTGQYGCCPFPKATCCNDHIHCCPHGLTCDVAGQTCYHGNLKIDWMSKVEARPEGVCCPDGVHCCPHGSECTVKGCVRSNISLALQFVRKMSAHTSKFMEPNVICPGGAVQCPESMTCCRLSSGWGCCPYKDAVCCSDKTTCCPSGTKCSGGGKCIKTSSTLKILPSDVNSLSIKCPDRSECPAQFTCCRMEGGMFGCCPFPKASCCLDGVHCCAEDYYCDKDSKCVLRKRTTARREIVGYSSHTCPGSTFTCTDRSTCCRIPGDIWGCCPFRNAVCCKDRIHCCPHGDHCTSSGCSSSASPAVILTASRAVIRMTSRAVIKPHSVVYCPDRHVCPSGFSCCKIASRGYGCCPYKSAVCCSDRIHCCPSGTKCRGRKCVKKTTALQIVSLKFNHESAVRCPDGSECHAHNTCCMMFDHVFGCCPYPDGICCKDHKYCCPRGSQCTSTGCTHSSHPVDIQSPSPTSVICPDYHSQCPNYQTCCILASGQYGCCPLPHAVCCKDKIHCCPAGFYCSGSGCARESKTDLVSYRKIWSQPHSPHNSVSTVNCPDGSVCPDEHTCCLIATRHYGCCPLPSAVCCADKIHCCPHGYSCTSAGCVLKNLHLIGFHKVLPSKKHSRTICPDKSYCDSRSTCCPIGDGHFGCCGYFMAVCCADKIHCCPHGYSCTSDGCVQKNLRLIGFHKVLTSKKHSRTICPDKSYCDSRSTCCPIGDGHFGCCGYFMGVCCKDHKFCCPRGSQCTSTGCSHSSHPVALKHPSPTSVYCPDHGKCPDKYTCCLLASGHYGCCAFDDAVCCSDGKHCCPHSYRCSPKGCVHSSHSGLIQLKAVTRVTSVLCPDKKTCPDGNTCCKVVSGEYGCCPLASAVCCADLMHCCPQGYHCTGGRCTRTGKHLLLTKLETSNHLQPKVNNFPCPGGHYSCEFGYTCCPHRVYGWACCPLSQAVCCHDNLHCCPQFTTCDLAHKRCIKKGKSIAMIKKVPAIPSYE